MWKGRWMRVFGVVLVVAPFAMVAPRLQFPHRFFVRNGYGAADAEEWARPAEEVHFQCHMGEQTELRGLDHPACSHCDNSVPSSRLVRSQLPGRPRDTRASERRKRSAERS